MQRSKREELEKGSVLYDHIQGRIGAYEVLLEALLECNQTGASKLLIEGIPNDSLNNATVSLYGRTVFLRDVFDSQDFYNIRSCLKETHTVTECQELFSKISPTYSLLKDTIPQFVSWYIPRRVEKRTNIDPHLFQIKCEDIFVFQGLEFTELNNIASEIPNKSGRQLLKIDTRFICLEFDEHWVTLSQIAKKPIHLISYYADKKTYNLQSTKGRSKILRQFLLKPVDYNVDQDLFLSEEQFTQICLSKKVVCICDRPGMGKSYLLANIARQVKPETNKVVAFIRLQSLMEFDKSKRSTNSNKKWNVKQRVLNFLSTSNLSYAILNQFDRKHRIKLDLFLDGFDEVENVNWAIQLLSLLKKENDCRIFVTSRPHMQDQLEDVLDVLSFNLLPFTQDDQIDYVVRLWKNWSDIRNTHKLVEFAKICLTKFCQKMSYGNEHLTGIPLQCYLLADVYAEKARTYSNTESGCVLNEQIIVESHFDIFNLYIAERLLKEADENKRQKIKYFHAWHAFKVVFPKLAETYYKLNGLSTVSNDYSSYLTYGLLEEHHNGTTMVYKFLHRTVAEFLVAMVIGEYVTNGFINPHNNFVKNFVTFVYEEFFLSSYKEQLIFNDFALKPLHHGYMECNVIKYSSIHIESFKYNVVVYFLNFYLHSMPDFSVAKTFQDSLRSVNTKEFEEICTLLKNCVFHNFSQIARLVDLFLSTKKRWFSPLIFRVTEPWSRPKLLEILIIFPQLETSPKYYIATIICLKK